MDRKDYHQIATGIFRRSPNQDVQTFMDDIILGSDEPVGRMYNELSEELLMDNLEMGIPIKFCGITLTTIDSYPIRSVAASMHAFVDSLVECDVPPTAEIDIEPFAKNEELLPEVDIALNIRESQEIVGRLAWMAQLCPPLRYLQSLFSSKLHTNPKLTTQLARKAISWYKKNKPELLFKSLNKTEGIQIRVWTDASHHIRHMSAHYAVIIQIVNHGEPLDSRINIIHVQVRKSQALVKSAFAAELQAAIHALGQFMLLNLQIKEIFDLYGDIAVQMYTDNKALHIAFQNRKTNDPFSQIYEKFFLQEMSKNNVEFHWVPTHSQLADSATKWNKPLSDSWTSCNL